MEPTAVLLLSDDLMFTSRISSTARELGHRVAVLRSPEQIEDQAKALKPRCVILDLNHPKLDVAVLVQALRQAGIAMPITVGYGSHVDAPVLRAAREAGVDIVLPRSRFVEELPKQLALWVAPPEPGGGP